MTVFSSRLEQLLDLRRRVDLEIEQERRLHPPRGLKPLPMKPNVVDQRLHELGVTTHDVKLWAVEQGLLPEVKRGRIAASIVLAYANSKRVSA